MNYEQLLFEYFNKTIRYIRALPLNLGGYSTVSGGGGGPPGGFTGYLPQTRVAHDSAELETLETATSGTSLVDNLNHIRARITNIEVASTELSVKNSGTIIGSGVTMLDFGSGLYAQAISSTEIVVTASGMEQTVPSGVFGESLTGQVDGVQTSFSTNVAFHPNSLRVYYNGVRQSTAYYTESVTNDGFTTTFTPLVGDTLDVDYDVYSDVSSLHTHDEYVTYTYLEDNYVSLSGAVAMLAEKADLVHTHVLSDITDFTYEARQIYDVPIASGTPDVGSVLQYDGSQYSPVALTVHQQFIFYIEGANASSGDVGVKPMRIYTHEVNTGATIDEIFISANTAPVTTALQINVLKNGSTVLEITPYIELGVGVSTITRSTNIVSDVVSKNDYFQIEIVQGDDNVSDITVHVRFSWEV